MYAIIFQALPKPGGLQTLINFLRLDCEVSQAEPGTLRFDAVKDPDSDMVYVYELYENQAAFEKHKLNEPFKKWKSDIEPNLKEIRTLFEGKPPMFYQSSVLMLVDH
jgi:quinol monooxygenase YgiN